MKKKLKISCRYEPTRLAIIHLLDAYHTLSPIIKHPIRSRKTEVMGAIEIIQPLRGNLK